MVLWAGGAFVVLLVLPAALLVWRLSQGPMPINVLIPYVEAVFANPQTGQRADIQDLVLRLDTKARHIDLQARQAAILAANGDTIMHFPSVDLTLSLGALARGKIALYQIGMAGAQVNLVRTREGRFGIRGALDGQPEQADLSQLLPILINAFVAEPDASRPLSSLREVRIEHGAVSVQDDALGLTWEAPQAEIALRRKSDGLEGELHVQLALPSGLSRLDAVLFYQRGSDRINLEATFADVRPSGLTTLLPQAGFMESIEVPLAGSLVLALDLDGQLQTLRFDLNGQAGVIALPDWLPTSRPIVGIEAQGDWDGSTRTLQLAHAALRFGTPQAAGPTILGHGKATDMTGAMQVEAQLTLKAVPMAELKDYWPLTVSPKARAWLTQNIVAGRLQEGQAHVALSRRPGTPGGLRLDRLDGLLRYQDLTVHFLRPLPPIVGVRGAGRFSHQGFDLDVEGGRIAGLNAASGRVTITGLNRQRDAIAIQEVVAGPLQEALRLLNHPRLNLLENFALDPAHLAGRMQAQVDFDFPLRGKVTLDKVNFSAHADLDEIAMRNLVLQQDISGGQAELTVNPQGMTLRGTADFAAIPLTLNWQESFAKQTAWRRHIQVKAPDVATTAVADVGLHLSDLVKGSFAAEAEATFAWDGKREIQGRIDLTQSELRVPLFHWQKAVGERATAAAVLTLADGQLASLRDLVLEGTTLALRGRGVFDPQQPTEASLELHHLRLGESRLHDVSFQHRRHHIDVQVGAGVLKIQPFDPAETIGDGPTRPEQAPDPPITFHLNAPALQRITFGPERYLEDVLVTLTRGRAGLERLYLAGQIPASLTPLPPDPQAEGPAEVPPRRRAFFLNYNAAAAGTDGLLGQVEDIGALLHALNFDTKITGGHLTLKGQNSHPAPEGPLAARLDVNNFTVHEAPQLARLIAALPSPTGLLNLMQNKGLGFDRLASEFTLSRQVATLAWLRTYGGALGLTADGMIDIGARRLNLTGTVIPLYHLNTLLGWVPGLDLLVGGKGQGLIAMNYRIDGPLEAPTVTVNPASLVTPGFLRGLFDIFAPQ
jgi:hypothetical protein